MTEQTDAAEGLAENERDRIWYALATTRCGPLHADDGWTPGEPCESCGDLANEVTPYLSRIVERLIAAREAAARAEERERVAAAIEAEADLAHAAFASDEDDHLADMRNRLGVTLEPGHWNRHDDGCSMCGMAGAARIVRAAQVAPSRAPEEES